MKITAAILLIKLVLVSVAYSDSPLTDEQPAPEPKIGEAIVVETPLPELTDEEVKQALEVARRAKAKVEAEKSVAVPEPIDLSSKGEEEASGPELIDVPIPEVQAPRLQEIVIDGERVVLSEFLAKWYNKSRKATVVGMTIEYHLAEHGVTECDFDTLDDATKHMLHSAIHERDRLTGRATGTKLTAKAKVTTVDPNAKEQLRQSPMLGNCPNGQCNRPLNYNLKFNSLRRQMKLQMRGRR